MEVVVVSAYCPTLEKQDKLRELIRKIKSFNYDIILVSHAHVPNDIIESCNYYFYDEENKLLYGAEYEFFYDLHLWGHQYLNGKKIQVKTKDSTVVRNSPNILLPVLNLVLRGLGLAKQLGYNYAHYIEYDCDVIKKDFFRNNTKILKEGNYENLRYAYTIPDGKYMGSLEMVMCYLAFNLEYYTFENLNYDEQIAIEEFKDFSPIFENYFQPKYLDFDGERKRKTYIKPLKYTVHLHKENEKNDIAYKDGLIRDNFKGHNVNLIEGYRFDILPIPIQQDENFNLYFCKYADNIEKKVLNLKFELTINNKVKKGIYDKQFECSLYGTGIPFDDIYYIRAMIDNKIIYEYNLDNEEEKRIFLQRNKAFNV